MDVVVKTIETLSSGDWDYFVHKHPASTPYHLFNWCNIIKSTYGHDPYYLIAQETSAAEEKEIETDTAATHRSDQRKQKYNQIAGVLPLVHIRHWFFGNSLVSMPYFDVGGIIAGDTVAEISLLKAAVELAEKLGTQSVELRHPQKLHEINSVAANGEHPIGAPQRIASTNWSCSTATHKVRMILSLPDNAERLMASLKSKLRSQIRKPIKEGLTVRVGGLDLVDDFYDVFCVNMRDLGSPVHAKKLIVGVLEQFPEQSRVFVVYAKQRPVASSLTLGFGSTLANPWASSLRQYSKLAPNMLLYWSMLEFACKNGYSRFDFGRSSPDSGTYKFKVQWGAIPEPLYWYQLSPNSKKKEDTPPEKRKMAKAIDYWKQLPVPVTRIIGPLVRKYISL